jgi:hypothetical protein
VSEAVQSQTSSSISYSKNLGFGNFSVNLLHSQNTKDSSYVFTLPNFSFSVNRFYPFKRKVRVGKERFYEQISLSYSTSFQNKINFKASEFMQEGFIDKFNNGMNHKVTIGLPSFTLLKYLNFSPGVNYGANMYFRTTSQVYNSETDKVEEVKSKQFSTLGITQTYSASISMSTRIYGLFQFNPQGSGDLLSQPDVAAGELGVVIQVFIGGIGGFGSHDDLPGALNLLQHAVGGSGHGAQRQRKNHHHRNQFFHGFL